MYDLKKREEMKKEKRIVVWKQRRVIYLVKEEEASFSQARATTESLQSRVDFVNASLTRGLLGSINN